jgi:hypothetical protein
VDLAALARRRSAPPAGAPEPAGRRSSGAGLPDPKIAAALVLGFLGTGVVLGSAIGAAPDTSSAAPVTPAAIVALRPAPAAAVPAAASDTSSTPDAPAAGGAASATPAATTGGDATGSAPGAATPVTAAAPGTSTTDTGTSGTQTTGPGTSGTPTAGTGTGPGSTAQPGPATPVALAGIVVHASKPTGTLAVAGPDGRITPVHFPAHGAGRVPAVGDRVEGKARPLRNGTYAADGKLARKGNDAQAKVAGTVTFADPASSLFVVSTRGVSMPVHVAAPADGSPAQLPPLAQLVTVSVTLPADGAPAEQQSLEDGGPSHDPLELTGVVDTLDPTAYSLTLSAEDAGTLPGRVTVKLPDTFDITKLKAHAVTAITATRADDGSLTATGLSLDASARQADDAQSAQGDQCAPTAADGAAGTSSPPHCQQ